MKESLSSVSFTATSIVSKFSGKITWEIKIGDVLLIGEYTNSAGPFFDDYFLVFVQKDEMFFELPFDAVGVASLISFLKEIFSDNICFGLCNSTENKSRILWPDQLLNKPLFIFSQGNGCALSSQMELSQDVINHIKQNEK